MYKIIFSLLFLIITPFIFSQQYYKSNSHGMELVKIGKYRTDEFEYYLEKIKEKNREIKILYKESVPVKETELYYSDDGAIEKEIITEDGIQTEKTYRDSRLYEEKVVNIEDQSGYIKNYKYNSNNLLDTVDEFSLDEKLQNSVKYERDSKGRIASVIRSINTENNEIQEDEISKYRFEEQNILDEWHGNSDLIGDFIYYKNGKISGIVKTDKGETISEKKYIYDSDFNLTTEEFIYPTEEKIIVKISAEGLVLEEVIYIGEKLISRRNDSYDDENRLIRSAKVTPAGVERYIYEYSGDDLSSEKIYFNGELYKEKIYLEDNICYEDFYSLGQKVLRIYYKDDEKTEVETW